MTKPIRSVKLQSSAVKGQGISVTAEILLQGQLKVTGGRSWRSQSSGVEFGAKCFVHPEREIAGEGGDLPVEGAGNEEAEQQHP